MKDHPVKYIKDKTYDDDERVEYCIDFLQERALLQPDCIDTGNRRPKQCSCLSVFAQEDETSDSPYTRAVARYMVYFRKKKKHEQQLLMIQWINSPNRPNHREKIDQSSLSSVIGRRMLQWWGRYGY